MFLSLHIIVQGIVQGVFCRTQIKEYADQHNLKGTVQNLANPQKVEIYIQGSKTKIYNFQQWLLTNPGSVKIEKIDIINQKTISRSTYPDFKIIV